MKRILAILLTLALAATLAGCGAAAIPAETTAAPATEGPQLITNVDDLLAAIAPNTEILLGEGSFNLSSAADYGKSGSAYYTWNDLGLGSYELQLQNVEGLTIRGCGKGKTTIVTEPRWANVLSITDCRNLTLEDMTLGHTIMAEACEGGVIRLNASETITLNGLGLYGCGSLGVQTYGCSEVTMQDCEVYECSIGGIHLFQTNGVTINSCAFHSLGKDAPVDHVFNIFDSDNVTVSNCMVSSNYVYSLIYAEHNGSVTFRGNQFTANQVAQCAFSLWAEGIVLENNVFEDNQIRNWYATGGVRALDGQGNEVVFEDPASAAVEVTPGEAIPVSTGEQTEVRVSNVEDFLKAIASDTCIILEAELLDFSTAQSYQRAAKDFEANTDLIPTYRDADASNYYWVNNFDGPSLVIENVSNLTIKAEGEDRKAHTLSAVPRYADVLTFENCAAITLQGFTAGHTIEPGYCLGGVFKLRNCEDILIDNCGMFGCGTMGVNAEYAKNIQVVNSEIYECSVAGIELTGCENVAISGTLIRDIGDEYGPMNHFRFYDNTNVTLDGEPLDGNYHGN